MRHKRGDTKMTETFARYRATLLAQSPADHPVRLAAGLVLILVVYVAVSIAVLGAGALIAARDTGSFDEGLSQMNAIRTPLATLTTLATFSGAILGLWLAVRILHAASLRSLLGHPGRILWRQLGLGLCIVLGAGAVAIAAAIVTGETWMRRPFAPWLALLGPALIVLVVQVSAEELVFRGYIQGRLARRFQSPAIWLMAPALLFGSLHYQPVTHGANAPIIAAAASLMGIVTGHVTARTRNISAAIGLHLGNNLIGIVLVASPGPLSGLALFVSPVALNDPAARGPLLLNLAAILVLYVLWLAVLAIRDRQLQDPGRGVK